MRSPASYFRIGSSFSSETRFGFGRNDVTRLDGIYTLGIAGIAGLTFPSNGGEILATSGHNWSIEEIVAVNKGRHSIKFGGLLQFQDQTRENAETPQVTYGNDADLLANDTTRMQLTFGLRPYLIEVLDERVLHPGRLQDPPEPGRQPGPPLRLFLRSHRDRRPAVQPRRTKWPRAAHSGIGGNI